MSKKETQIKKFMAKGMTYEEALELWEFDNEVDHMTVSEIKKTMTDEEKQAYKEATRAESTKKADGEKRKRTYNPSDEKVTMFEILKGAFKDYETEIAKENKLLLVKVGEKTFKIDLIEQRGAKKNG